MLVDLMTPQLSLPCRKVMLLFAVCCYSTLSVFAQQASEIQLKGAYIYRFIDHVEWEDEDDSAEIIIGIYGDNNPLYEELSSAIAGTTIRDKAIRVNRIDELAEAGTAHILVIPESENAQLENIARIVRRSNTLLVTDRSPQNRSTMINFLQPEQGQISFEVNRPNIVYEGLTLSTDILLLGGTEIDIAELYLEMDASLLTIQSSFEEQQAIIDQQAQQVRTQEREIQENLQELQLFEQRVLDLNNEIENYDTQIAARETSLITLQNQQEELNNTLQGRQRELEIARDNLQQGEAELEENEAQILTLQQDITSNVLILEAQQEEMNRQQENLLRQGEEVQQLGTTVETQQSVLVLFGLLLILFVIAALVAYWGFRKLQRMGKSLADSNAELQVRKQEAESATAAKASFLAAMSHEIRTPMNGVVGMVDLLSQTNMDDEQNQMLQTVRDSGHSLLTIINDILDFSKIEAGKLDLEAVESNVTDLVETVAQTLAPSTLKKNVQLLTYIDPRVPQQLLMDPVRIRQILINLGSNAIKFSKMSEVIIKAELAQPENNTLVTLRFSVVDQGIGISPDAQKDLFKEFSQADTSTTRKFGGTGLGLAICKRLTDMMGGVIGVTSRPGEGSTFYCEIPFPVSVEPEGDKAVNDLSKLRVLLVSPSENYQQLCTSYLHHWNAEVESIEDLTQCLESIQTAKANNQAFDVIVIPHTDDPERLSNLRNEFIAPEIMSDTRFVIGKDPRKANKALAKLQEVTFLDINPLKRAGLVAAVAVASGMASPEISSTGKVFKIKGGRAPTPEEALEQGKLVLLAEDNLTNQDVIRRQLTHIGYACEIANDGKEAYDMWSVKSYALLLTDCHMPEMDGFELTAAIREQEKSTSRRLPIIAVTANALQGEAERCLDAGMDDYMSKPIDMKILQQKLQNWMGDGSMAEETGNVPDDENPSTADTAASADSSNDAPPIDKQVLIGLFGDDEETFKEILQGYVDASADIIDALMAAREDGVVEEVQGAAHKLKSSSRSVGANELADICQTLETAEEGAYFENMEEQLAKIAPLFQSIREYVATL